jgi:hypothetical protein
LGPADVRFCPRQLAHDGPRPYETRPRGGEGCRGIREERVTLGRRVVGEPRREAGRRRVANSICLGPYPPRYRGSGGFPHWDGSGGFPALENGRD